MDDYKELIGDIDDCLIAHPNETLCKRILREAADAIERLVKERDAAVDDLEKCIHYAEPKNNNVCNFCKKDMSEYPDKCDGWSDFCKCEPEWRGAKEVELD